MEAEELQDAATAAAEPVHVQQKDAMQQHQDEMEQTEGEAASESMDGSEMVAEDDGEDGVDWELLLDPSKYRHVKRTPLRPPTRQCDIYCTTSRQQRVLLKRAYRLLVEERLPFVVLHGLGAAVPVAIDVALQLMGEVDANHNSLYQRVPPLTEEQIRSANAEQRTEAATAAASSSSSSSSSALPLSLSPFARSFFTVSTVTGTEVLIDDYEPLIAGLQPVSQRRQNSSIHITVRVSAEAGSELLGTAPRTVAAAVGSSGPQPGAYRGRGRGGGGRGGARGGAGRGRGAAGGAGGSAAAARGGRGGGSQSRPTTPSSQPWKRQKR